MKIGTFDVTQRVMLIAEIGNNHEGDFALAAKLIELAAQSGADAVKFQSYHTPQFINPEHRDRFDRLKSFELSGGEFARLAEVARRCGVLFLSTPFDLDAVAYLDALVPAFKVSSSDNTHLPLLEAVARTGKPILLSSGLADIEVLRSGRDHIHCVWQQAGIAQQVAILHCVCSYPTVPEEANLHAITAIREQLGGIVGYSDHTLGLDAAVLSVALGARIIEKHFTHDHHHSDFRDHQLAAEPDEFRTMVDRVRAAEVMLGQPVKAVQASERGVMELVRRSIVAKTTLEPGHVIGWDDLAWTRPAGGLSPGEEDRVLGRQVRQSIAAGERITVDRVA